MRALYDLPAPAKINLFLHVIGRRTDGYHLLQSVFVLIDWCDTLHFERRDDARLQRHDLSTALPADDLCLRAARALQQAAGVQIGADISIDKRVPWGAGLGGGSSDAATTLLALNRLWGLHWPREQLQRIAVTLGADVPFFVGGHNAWVEGIGEQLAPIDWPPREPHPASSSPTHSQWLAVVKPATSIPTSAIFGSPLLARDTKHAIVTDFLAASNAQAIDAETGNKNLSGSAKSFMRFGQNDLQKPAQAYSNEVSQALDLLSKRFGNSRMTGSGSAVFADAGFGSAPTALMPESSALPAEWIGRMCQCLPQHPLLEWAA
ncbi:4-(cytidine 5'-diphospho)-2-C-methyl-D-erythritol kinase [Aquabacterium sp.]|uniref:4-(cytidine 5'-diphospho)-2-C-methyl-D-erythritol kinase n=1 Tax=Aquabacterium sp. TaxID=1872578 RepID=UPI0035B100C3